MGEFRCRSGPETSRAVVKKNLGGEPDITVRVRAERHYTLTRIKQSFE